jgi:hypothetical protein
LCFIHVRMVIAAECLVILTLVLWMFATVDANNIKPSDELLPIITPTFDAPPKICTPPPIEHTTPVEPEDFGLSL